MEQYFIIFAVIFIIAFIVSSYNKIISHHRTVIQSWDDVTVTERQKLKILPELQKMLEEHKIHESSLLSKITELRSSVAKISSDNIDHSPVHAVGSENTDVPTSSVNPVCIYP